MKWACLARSEKAAEPRVVLSPDDLRAGRFLHAKGGLAAHAIQEGTLRLKYAYLVALGAVRTHLVRGLTGVRVVLQSVDARAHRRFGKHVVPLALLDRVIRSNAALHGFKSRLERRHLHLRLTHLERRTNDLLYELRRAAAAPGVPQEPPCSQDGFLDEPGDLGRQVDDVPDVEVQASSIANP